MLVEINVLFGLGCLHSAAQRSFIAGVRNRGVHRRKRVPNINQRFVLFALTRFGHGGTVHVYGDERLDGRPIAYVKS